jgi:hypothetical protein
MVRRIVHVVHKFLFEGYEPSSTSTTRLVAISYGLVFQWKQLLATAPQQGVDLLSQGLVSVSLVSNKTRA